MFPYSTIDLHACRHDLNFAVQLTTIIELSSVGKPAKYMHVFFDLQYFKLI